MIPDFGTILAVAVIAAIIGGLFWYSRRTPAQQAKIQAQVTEAAGDAGDAVKALREVASKLVDRLHDSTPATPAPATAATLDTAAAAQINAAASIVAAAAYVPKATPASAPPTTIERAGAILAGDLPGMTAAERAATRPATELDMAKATPPQGGSTWPQTWILADGTRVLAKAPLSPLYRTSFMGTLMGKPIPGGGGHAADPANGDEVNPPLPLRSPAGFPIRYSIAAGKVVGTPTILFADESFNSDAEVLDFIRRTMKASEDAAARQRSAQGVAEWTGEEDPAALWKAPGDLGYPTREAMYAARVPWLYRKEQAKLLADLGYNADHPYKTAEEK